MILEELNSHPFMWYGCIIKPNKESKPILFTLNRMGYLMDGAEINDDGSYDSFESNHIGIVKCLFIKDGNAISPEQAFEDYKYKDMVFEIKCERIIRAYSASHGSIDNLNDLLSENPEEFKLLIEEAINDYLEEVENDKPYRAALIAGHDEKGKKSPFIMYVDRLGRITEHVKCIFSKENSHPIFDVDKIKFNEAIAIYIKFRDGTKPITMSEARNLVNSGEMNGIFLESSHIGSVLLTEDSEYDTWEDALTSNDEKMIDILKFGIFSLAENSEFETQMDEMGDDYDDEIFFESDNSLEEE